jgi:hypothetical protein
MAIRASMTNIQEILAGVVAKVPDAGVMSDLDACAAWAGKNGGDGASAGDHRLLLGRAHHSGCMPRTTRR